MFPLAIFILYLFMKRLVLFFFVCLLSHGLFAQGKIFLFEKFTTATVKMRPRGVTRNAMNYDANGGKMYFMQGETMMELTGVNTVDTISWGERKFIPVQNRFREVMKVPNGLVYVDWVLRDLVVGKKGAYGLRTEGSVQNLRLYDFGGAGGVSSYTPYDNQGTYVNDILKRKNQNVYYFEYKGKVERVKSLKNLDKIFPEQIQEIHDFIKEHDVAYDDVLSVLDLLNFCMGF